MSGQKRWTKGKRTWCFFVTFEGELMCHRRRNRPNRAIGVSALEQAFCVEPPTLFVGFSLDQSLILLVIIECLKHRFHGQAKILGCLFRRFPLPQHRRQQVPDMHVAAFDPENFPPRVWARLKVFISNFGLRPHDITQFNMAEVG